MTQQIEEPVVKTPAIAPSRRPHFRYVDGFRGVAALYVVLHHAFLMTLQTGDRAHGMTGVAAVLMGFLQYGESAVTFFIAISGFCLMLPLVDDRSDFGAEASKRFFYRRARRILPTYYSALLLSMALTTVFVSDVPPRSSGPLQPTTTAGIVSHLLLVHNLHESTIYQINGPLWSIAVECQIYLVFPLLVALRRSFGMPAMLGIAYMFAMLARSLLAGTPYGGLMPMYLFVFALGMSAAEFAMGPPRRLFLWMASAATALMIFMFLYPQAQRIAGIEAVVGLCSMCFLTVGAHWPNSIVTRVASWRPLAFMGTFSYSLYLIHSPLQQLSWKWIFVPLKLDELWTFGLGATIGTALILFVSYWFYVLAERPFCTNPSS